MGAWHLTVLLLLLIEVVSRAGSVQDDTDHTTRGSMSRPLLEDDVRNSHHRVTPKLPQHLLKDNNGWEDPVKDTPDSAPVNGENEQAKTCEVARLKCAYRTGCGYALQNYLVGCSLVVDTDDIPAPHDPLAGRAAARRCPEPCQIALIALTSTPEGKHLMNCRCTDEFCEETKRRVEVCRPEVLEATRNESVVSCRVAQWICAADYECSTALEYYHRNCRGMFSGKRCSHRCNNSLGILLRQARAAKLATCRCDGSEDYDCTTIRDNMARLCFHRLTTAIPPNTETNEVEPRSSSVVMQAPLLGRVLLVLAVQLMQRSLLAQDT